MEHVETRRNGGGHRPPANKHLRGVVPPPPPLKVYCVEPRDFRDLVQRLTGAAAPAPPVGLPGQRATLTPAAQSYGQAPAAAGQFDYSPWFSAPLFSPAYAPGGFEGHHQHGHGNQQQGR